MKQIRAAALPAAALLLAAAGPTQPQTVAGACKVDQFFLVALGTSNTTMRVAANSPCQFTLINPALQAFQTAALVTEAPAHGQAQAGLLEAGRTVLIHYQPSPGFSGTDRFTTTIEPNDKAVVVHVTVGGR